MASNEYNIDDKYTIVVEEQNTFQLELNKQGPQGERGPIGPVGPQGDKGEKGDQGIQGEVGPKGDTGVSVVGVEEISKVGLVATYRMTFSNGEYFDYEVIDGSIDSLTREQVISLIGYEPASYTSVEGLTTRVSTLEERIEDLTTSKFPNIVIVGTPPIEGGQVSSFSNTDYLQFPFVDISRGLPFDIYFSFTTGSDVVTQQNVLDSYFGIALAIQNSKGIMALSSNGTSWDIGNVTGTNTILPNTTYYAKCSWTGTQYNASLSTNNTTYVPDMIIDSTLTTNKTTIFIGCSPDLFGAGTAHPFKGTINFNNSRVDVQGTTVWEGMADVGLASRANVSLNNLDEVGEKRFTDIQIALDGKQDKGTSGSGLEVCDIGMALYVDETKGLRRYLNGQIVDINTNTQAFLNRLKEITTLHPSLLCTEEEWQTAKTNSAFGQVGKFVFNYSGDEVVSVRIPRVVNVQGLFDLQNLGMTVAESLPNIKGSFYGANIWNYTGSGAFHLVTEAGTYPLGTGRNVSTVDFNASRSSSAYKDGAHVQQEAIQYPYFIQIATGSETENNIVNDIELNNPYSLFDSKYSDHELNNLSWLKSEGQWNAKAVYPTAYDKLLKVYNGTETVEGLSVKLSTETYTAYDFVLNTTDETFRLPLLDGDRVLVEKKVMTSDNKTWYNLYSDGWCEQGGVIAFLDERTVTLLKPFVDTNYNISTNLIGSDGAYLAMADATISKITTTTFYIGYKGTTPDGVGTAIGYFWEAKGYTDIPINTSVNLYFYVGETVQNTNLIDAGRIGEQLATKTDMLQASGAGMPSSRYIDLTVGASGSTYTAPANGYYNFGYDCGSDCYASLATNELESSHWQNSNWSSLFLPVKKGTVMRLIYRNLTKRYFRFIYAEGEV